MPTTFQKADDTVLALLAGVLTDYHPDLAEVAVNIGVVLAYNPDKPAVMHGGYPALATIKPCSPKDRVTKGYDAELTIDQVAWTDLAPAQRRALLDHECAHIAPKPVKKKKGGGDDDGQRWQFDDSGRPKLVSVKGDWNAGDGFAAVVARHGLNAIEYRNIADAKRRADEARAEGEGDKRKEV